VERGDVVTSLDTHVEGDPASVRTAATWLRSTVRTSSSTLGDEVYQQRSKAASAWEGGTGEVFGTRLTTVGTASDGVSEQAAAAATTIDELATALQKAQDEMDRARSTARGGGLTVTGDSIVSPGEPPPDVAALPADATPAQAAAYDAGVARIEAYDAKVAVWDEVVEIVEDARAALEQRIADGAGTWESNRGNLVGLFSDFTTGGIEGALAFKIAKLLGDGPDVLLGEAAKYRADANALRTGVRTAVPENLTPLQRAILQARQIEGVPSGSIDDFNRLMSQADDLEARASNLRAAGLPEIPKGLSRTLKGLGAAALGYGIYADMQDGESATQAVVSNGVGFGASVAAGAAIGTLIPVPGVGTAVGALGGAVVGLFVSGMADSFFDNGMDSLSDVGGAIVDGAQEVGDTAVGIYDLGSDAVDAVGEGASDLAEGAKDGVKDAWHSVFG
jgi:hypothetical protein